MKLSNIYKEYKSSILGFAIFGLSCFSIWFGGKENLGITIPLATALIGFSIKLIGGSDDAINKLDGSTKPEAKEDDTQG